MSERRTKIRIGSFEIVGPDGLEHVSATATMVDTGFGRVSFPQFTITLSPEETKELMAFSGRVAQRTLDELREKL